MKKIKWKSMIITCLVTLVPILAGVFLWDRLPSEMAIHFNINNEPDNFSSKGFAVFGLPLMMMGLQVICCLINDFNAAAHGERKKFERVTKWIIPVMSILIQGLIFAYALGVNVDARKAASVIVGTVLLVIGNYMPKFENFKDDADTEKARKIHRFIGFLTVVMGILFIISALLPPVFSIACLLLLIPYAIVCAVFGIKVGRG